jgi:hypothetical protein
VAQPTKKQQQAFARGIVSNSGISGIPGDIARSVTGAGSMSIRVDAICVPLTARRPRGVGGDGRQPGATPHRAR